MKFIGIIPARYHSTRFPGKPLALIFGKPMIQWVVERSKQALDEVWVATDDEKIRKTVSALGINVVMTSTHHQSGTDRVAEAARILSSKIDFDIIINIQGDEPFIQPEQINQLKSCFTPGVEIATLVQKIETLDELDNSNKPKVVVGKSGQALYFSRAAIPYIRGQEKKNWLSVHTFWAHVGMYGYRADILEKIQALSAGLLETAESLEQLRWLENGYKIQVKPTEYNSYGIDTPEDLDKALQLFKK